MDKKITSKSMIYGMKFRKTDKVVPERIQAETLSPAFEDLFYKHWSDVHRLLVRLVGDPAEAEDLALECFLRLHQGHPTPGQDFNVGGWLYRVATNLGLHSIRSYERRERYELAGGKNALDEVPENQPTEIIDAKEDQRAARIVLSEMKRQQAEILILRYSGMAYKEIAETLGLSPASIGPLLLRAEREFEKRFRALVKEE